MAELAPVKVVGERIQNFWGKDLGPLAGAKADLIGDRMKWHQSGTLIVILANGKVESKKVHGAATMRRAWRWKQVFNEAAKAAEEKVMLESERDVITEEGQ